MRPRRTIAPPGGSFVRHEIPALCRASVLYAPASPVFDTTMTGSVAETVSSSSRVGGPLLLELRLVVAEAEDDAVPLREVRAQDPHPERVADGRDRVRKARRRRRHVRPQRLERRSGLPRRRGRRRLRSRAWASSGGPSRSWPGSSPGPSAAEQGTAPERESVRSPRRGPARSGRSGSVDFPFHFFSTSARVPSATILPSFTARASGRASLPARIGPPYHTKSAFSARAAGARAVRRAARTAAAQADRGAGRVIGAPMVTPAGAGERIGYR